MEPIKLFFAVVFSSVVLELTGFLLFKRVFGKPLKFKHHDRLFRNIISVSAPILGLCFLIFGKSYNLILIFLIFAIIGTLIEYLLGNFFYLVERKKIWSYQYLKIGEYTSWLSIPYWGGGGGLLFVLIYNLVNSPK